MGNLSLSTRKSSQVSLPCTIEQTCRLASHRMECREKGSACVASEVFSIGLFGKSKVLGLDSTSLQLCPGGSHTLSSGHVQEASWNNAWDSKQFHSSILSLTALLASDVKISRCSWCVLWLKAKNCGLFSHVASTPPQGLSQPMMPLQRSPICLCFLVAFLLGFLWNVVRGYQCHKFTNWNQKKIEKAWQRPNTERATRSQKMGGKYKKDRKRNICATLHHSGRFRHLHIASKEIRPTPRNCLGGCIFAILSFSLLLGWYRILSLVQSQISNQLSRSLMTCFEKPGAGIYHHTTRMTHTGLSNSDSHCTHPTIISLTWHNSQLARFKCFNYTRLLNAAAATAQTEMESDHFFSLPAPLLDPDTGRPW